MNQQDLRIATRNVNGILCKKHEIEVLLNTQYINVCLISTTHITNQSCINLRGKLSRTMHPYNQAKGGYSFYQRFH